MQNCTVRRYGQTILNMRLDLKSCRVRSRKQEIVNKNDRSDSKVTLEFHRHPKLLGGGENKDKGAKNEEHS